MFVKWPLRAQIVFTVLLFSVLLNAQTERWTACGPANQWVQCVAVDPQDSQYIWVGTKQNGVYCSSDHTISWAASNTGLNELDISHIAIDPQAGNVLYLSTAANVYKSIDRGSNWNLCGPIVADASTLAINCITIHPQVTDIIFVAIKGVGVFKSANGGATWAKVLWSANIALNIIQIAIDDQHPDMLYAIGNEVYQSADRGETWELNAELTNMVAIRLAIDPANSLIQFALTAAGIYKSVDGGVTWSPKNVDLQAAGTITLAVNPQNANLVYVLTANAGVYKSYNGAETWMSVNAGIGNYALHIVAFDEMKPSTVYGIAANGTLLTITFGYDIYAVTFLTGDGGSVSGAQNQNIHNGGSTTPVTANPDPGYRFSGWTGPHGFNSTQNPLTIDNVCGKMVVTADFTYASTFLITASVAGGHGSVTPESQTVPNGANAVMVIRADEGYHVVSISDNGLAVAVALPFVLAHVTTDHSIVVTFGNDPPAISIVQPQEGITVYGEVPVVALIGDDSGLSRVEFYLDGQLMAANTNVVQNPVGGPVQAEYRFAWQSSGYENKTHTIQLVATDLAHTVSSRSVSVRLQNIILHATAQRLLERSWLIQRYFGCVQLTVENSAAIPVAYYELYRKVDAADFNLCKTINNSELQNNIYTFNDTFLNEKSTYAYFFQAKDQHGAIIVKSAAIILTPDQ